MRPRGPHPQVCPSQAKTGLACVRLPWSHQSQKSHHPTMFRGASGITNFPAPWLIAPIDCLLVPAYLPYLTYLRYASLHAADGRLQATGEQAVKLGWPPRALSPAKSQLHPDGHCAFERYNVNVQWLRPANDALSSSSFILSLILRRNPIPPVTATRDTFHIQQCQGMADSD